MTLRGSCRCYNLTVSWQNVDYSLVPRACDCHYCRHRGAVWVSKSGSALNLQVQRTAAYVQSHQGSEQAAFHECRHCGDVVAVTVLIDDDRYGAVNLNCLRDACRFPPAVMVQLTGLAPEEKRERWRQNWCCPVTLPLG